MTNKRYYQRDFEELYYIIDSEKVSEKEFDEKYEYDGYSAFEDSLTGEEIVDLLNENEYLKQSHKEILKDLEVTTFDKELLQKENEQLKQQIKELYNFVKCDVDNEIDVYPKCILEYLINILKIIGDVE